jgi:hypothetical protein
MPRSIIGIFRCYYQNAAKANIFFGNAARFSQLCGYSLMLAQGLDSTYKSMNRGSMRNEIFKKLPLTARFQYSAVFMRE